MHTLARWTALGSLFLIPFLPLYVAGELFFPFITGKAFAFRILVEIGFAAWIALAVIDPKYRPKFSYVLVSSGLLVAWMFVANLLGENPHKALWSNFERMEGWITLVHVFAFMVFASAMLSAENLWRRWWLTSLSATAIVVGYGLLQSIGSLETHQGDRIDASFGNAAYLPAYLLFAVAIALWQALTSKGWLRTALIALAVGAALIVFLSATRGAFLGLIGGGAFALLLWLFEAKGQGRKIAIGVLLALVVVLGGLFAVRDASFISENQTLSRLTSIFDPASLDVRFTIWNMALAGAAERPLTGWGQEGYNYVFAKHYNPALFAQEPWFDRAHNVFLDWLIAGGFPALLLFLALLASIVVGLYRGTFTRIERVALIGALVAYSIQGLAVFDNLFTYVPLFAIAAMVHSRVARDIPSLSAMRVAPNTAQVVVPVALAVGLAVVWVVNVPNISAASKLITALSGRSTMQTSLASFQQALAEPTFGTQEIREQLVMYAGRVSRTEGIPDADKRAVLALAATEILKEVERAPNDTRLRVEAADALAGAGDYQGAYAQMDAALALSPKKQTTYLQYGSIAWQQKDYQKAHSAFVSAYELDTSFELLAAYAAAGKVLIGDNAAADEILMSAYGTTVVDTNFLRLAYYETGQINKLLALGKKAVDDSGGSPQTRLTYAVMLASAGRVAEAYAEIDATVAAHPEVAADAAQLRQQIQNATQ